MAADADAYFKYLAELNTREVSNADHYDRALLTLSSALLAVSITFIHEVAPLNTDVYLGLLYSAWILLTVTVLLTLGGFVYGQAVIQQLKVGAKKFFIDDDKSEDKNAQRLSGHLTFINRATGVCFAIGLSALILFVIINVQEVASMKRPTTPTTTERAQPVPTPQQYSVTIPGEIIINTAPVPTYQQYQPAAPAAPSTPAPAQPATQPATPTQGQGTGNP